MGIYNTKTQPDSIRLFESGRHIFNPGSVAVIGAWSDREKEYSAGWVGKLTRFGYRGKIFPVNPRADSILGLKSYPSMGSIPAEVDYAIITVPAQAVPGVVRECIDKKVKVAHIFSAGFNETGGEKGRALQSQIAQLVAGSNTRIIGPNCMGVYSPDGGLSFDLRFAQESGPIGFISQSGVGGRRLIHLAIERGLRFSKAVSFGNAIDLDATDFLEYYAADESIKILLLYIEGLRNGSKFFNLLKRAAAAKPTILIKAGLSESGAGAAASHTGSLAGSRQVWQALFRQAGVIHVSSFEEAVDQLVAVMDIGHIAGMNVALAGRGGGFGVVAADICEANGLKVPALTDSSRVKLAKLTPSDSGSSIRNPVEIGLGVTGLSPQYSEGLSVIAADPNIDSIISFLNPEDYMHYGNIGEGWVEQVSRVLIDTAHSLSKPLGVSFMQGSSVQVFQWIQDIQHNLQKEGVPCYNNLESAIKATAKLAAYCAARDRRGKL